MVGALALDLEAPVDRARCELEGDHVLEAGPRDDQVAPVLGRVHVVHVLVVPFPDQLLDRDEVAEVDRVQQDLGHPLVRVGDDVEAGDAAQGRCGGGRPGLGLLLLAFFFLPLPLAALLAGFFLRFLHFLGFFFAAVLPFAPPPFLVFFLTLHFCGGRAWPRYRGRTAGPRRSRPSCCRRRRPRSGPLRGWRAAASSFSFFLPLPLPFLDPPLAASAVLGSAGPRPSGTVAVRAIAAPRSATANARRRTELSSNRLIKTCLPRRRKT